MYEMTVFAISTALCSLGYHKTSITSQGPESDALIEAGSLK